MKPCPLLLAAATMAAFPSLLFAAPAFDTTTLAGHIRTLASDAFAGRAPGTDGEDKTVAYLVEQFKAAGLQPGGELTSNGRAWTQEVPLMRYRIEGPVTIDVSAGGEMQHWRQGEQIAVRATQLDGGRVEIRNAPVVFVGYGVKAPERDWDDFKGIDVRGKIVLMLINDPDYVTGAGVFGGRAMTYYGRWTYKFEEAARQGALGCLIIHETEPASYGWNTVKNSNVNDTFDIASSQASPARLPLKGWIQRDVAVDLFRKSGIDFEAAKASSRFRDFQPLPLTKAALSATFAVASEKIVSRNVVAVVPGKTRADERIIYSAHWDHLGVGLPDANGDKIFNGALDNASGVAQLIELGRAFAHAPRPDRSVVFLAVTAEEKGLLGSTYYAANPLYPLATTVANINMDGAAVFGPTRDISTSGDAPLTLQDDLIAAAQAHGRTFTPDTRPADGNFFRSDHFPFAKQGVPAISLEAGQDLINGGKERGRAIQDVYIRERYHQPADEFDPAWDLTGMSQDLAILYDLGHELATSRSWPSWKAGSEFKVIRDQTSSSRK